MSKSQRETLLKGSRKTERAAKAWHWPRLFKKEAGARVLGKQERFEDWTKRRAVMGEQGSRGDFSG